ncbi:MAG: response regulator transcription factor [Desulfurella sp.]|jgi:DNA-binding response OmpR family regulator|uniref:response regulator transcription factor n=1 Tax=Desulfurella sp. TaxID=1962857 RepID=UPI0003E0AC5A|nr:response regulator transcription factor [Desulfurella sp.]AHF96481.1 PhoB family transcriptional regulator [Desulfurella acetivorans A63]PMP91069.1 MAG: DNA-binding response regulator [Desulfurella sp.]HEX12917.1 response regulator transcription factor [Desulfurella acetivorans]
MKILLLEDDKTLGKALKELLEQNGFETEWITELDDFSLFAKTRTYDLFIMDRAIKNKDSIYTLKELRKTISTPAIFLTVKSSLSDKLEGFEAQIDDYITKPFYKEELLARIRAIANRNMPKGILKVKNIEIDTQKHVVYIDSKPIENLTQKEFMLLEYLVRNKNKVVKTDSLIDYIWNEDGSIETLKSHIYSLRKKLSDKDLIKTIKGYGYKIDE